MYPTFVQLSVHIENYSFSKEFTCLLVVLALARGVDNELNLLKR